MLSVRCWLRCDFAIVKAMFFTIFAHSKWQRPKNVRPTDFWIWSATHTISADSKIVRRKNEKILFLFLVFDEMPLLVCSHFSFSYSKCKNEIWKTQVAYADETYICATWGAYKRITVLVFVWGRQCKWGQNDSGKIWKRKLHEYMIMGWKACYARGNRSQRLTQNTHDTHSLRPVSNFDRHLVLVYLFRAFFFARVHYLQLGIRHCRRMSNMKTMTFSVE